MIALPGRSVRSTRLARPARATGGWAVALIVLAASLLALLMGAVAGLGSILLVLPFAMVLGGLAIAFSPVTALVWGMVSLSLLVVGPAIYFAHVESARWIVPGLGVALLLPAMLVSLRPADRQAPSPPMLPAFVPLGLFLAVAVVSTAVNRSLPGDWINFLRHYLIMVPLIVLLASGAFDARQWKGVWLFYIGASLLQLPVSALQHFVFAARQVRSADWDAVVGTFPGQAEGGGASAAMGVYVVIAVVFALTLWKRRQLGGFWAVSVLLAALGTIALAEVKAVVLLLGLAIGLVYIDELRRRPGRVLLLALTGLAVSAALMTAYMRLHYEDRVVMGKLHAPRTPLEAIQNQLNPETESRYTGEMGRVASFVHWWDMNGRPGHWSDVLVGHGASSTQFNRFSVGELVPRYRHPLNQTSTGVLLWEVGLLGHLALVVGLGMAAAAAWRLTRREGLDPQEQALLQATAISLVLIILTLPYKSFIFSTAPSQVMLAMMLGYVAHAWRLHAPARVRPARGAARRGARARGLASPP